MNKLGPPPMNLMGQRFHMLQVVSATKDKKGRAAWILVCDCGNETIAQAGALRSGQKKSCGCLAGTTANAVAARVAARMTANAQIGQVAITLPEWVGSAPAKLLRDFDLVLTADRRFMVYVTPEEKVTLDAILKKHGNRYRRDLD